MGGGAWRWPGVQPRACANVRACLTCMPASLACLPHLPACLTCLPASLACPPHLHACLTCMPVSLALSPLGASTAPASPDVAANRGLVGPASFPVVRGRWASGHDV